MSLNPTVANDPGMSKQLQDYLGERQCDALFIEAILSLATLCVEDGRKALLESLIDEAHDAAKSLNKALDSVNLPGKGSA